MSSHVFEVLVTLIGKCTDFAKQAKLEDDRKAVPVLSCVSGKPLLFGCSVWKAFLQYIWPGREEAGGRTAGRGHMRSQGSAFGLFLTPVPSVGDNLSCDMSPVWGLGKTRLRQLQVIRTLPNCAPTVPLCPEEETRRGETQAGQMLVCECVCVCVFVCLSARLG